MDNTTYKFSKSYKVRLSLCNDCCCFIKKPDSYALLILEWQVVRSLVRIICGSHIVVPYGDRTHSTQPSRKSEVTASTTVVCTINMTIETFKIKY